MKPSNRPKAVLIIDESYADRVKSVLFDLGISCNQAGFPNGSYTLKETFESKIGENVKEKVKKKKIEEKPIKFKPKNKISESEKMLNYAKQINCQSIPEAIFKLGSGRMFRQKFKKEYIEIT